LYTELNKQKDEKALKTFIQQHLGVIKDDVVRELLSGMLAFEEKDRWNIAQCKKQFIGLKEQHSCCSSAQVL
jgi:hypothetical protein